MKRKVATFGVVCVVLAPIGCAKQAPIALMKGAVDVVVGKKGPPDGRKLGPIEASHGEGCGAFGTKGTRSQALNKLLNQAVRQGANYVQITREQGPRKVLACMVNSYTIRGVAWRTGAVAGAVNGAVSKRGIGRKVISKAAAWTRPSGSVSPAGIAADEAEFRRALDVLKDCRAGHGSYERKVGGKCYGDHLLTLLTGEPDRIARWSKRAYFALAESKPTKTTDESARYRMLWSSSNPTVKKLMRSFAAYHAEVANQALFNLKTGARGLQYQEYLSNERAIDEAFGWALPEVPDMMPRRDPVRDAIMFDLYVLGARYQRWLRQRPTERDLREALPDGTLFIDYVSFRRLAPKNYAAFFKPQNGFYRRPEAEDYLFAFALYKEGGRLQVRGRDLGPVDAYEAPVAALRTAILDIADVSPPASALYDALLAPFDDWLARSERLIISPAGPLHVMPFDVLQKDGRFVADQVPTLLSDVRDLLSDSLDATLRLPKDGLTAPVIVADPDFAYGVSAARPVGGAGRRGIARPKMAGTSSKSALEALCSPGSQRGRAADIEWPAEFSPLPCLRLEANAIHRLTRGQSRLIAGDAATEHSLRALERPRFLHVATHGFFIGAPMATDRGSPSKPVPLAFFRNPTTETRLQLDPLYGSGLALRGANLLRTKTGRRWKEGRDDGLLTAAEAQRLNLVGTEVVVLSACDTGRAVSDSQGTAFYGLRHAFRSAGARNVVSSLWSVSDVTTYWLMEAFYEHYLAGEVPMLALNKARAALRQRCRKRDCDHPFFWAPFVVEGVASK